MKQVKNNACFDTAIFPHCSTREHALSSVASALAQLLLHNLVSSCSLKRPVFKLSTIWFGGLQADKQPSSLASTSNWQKPARHSYYLLDLVGLSTKIPTWTGRRWCVPQPFDCTTYFSAEQFQPSLKQPRTGACFFEATDGL